MGPLFAHLVALMRNILKIIGIQQIQCLCSFQSTTLSTIVLEEKSPQQIFAFNRTIYAGIASDISKKIRMTII